MTIHSSDPLFLYNWFMHPAIFLDRDGIIIKNRRTYVRNWLHVRFYKQSLLALAKLSETPFKIVVVTNQSAVGRGLIPSSTANDINRRIVDEIEKAGGRIDGVFMCPHRPDEVCSCRKPKPGLLLQASEALSIDLKRSVLIGDAISDIQAGQNAGLAKTILVLTGRGRTQMQQTLPTTLKPFLVYQSLSHAVHNLKVWLPKVDQ